MGAIQRYVHNFINKEGDYVNYILDCPLKKRQFKGGKNKGQFYASPGDCDWCKYKSSVTYVTKIRDFGKIETPFYETVFCNGHTAPSDEVKKWT